jgi:hypothetical protein
MVTVKLVGGLGNQLFGYYFGQSLNREVRYDISDQLRGLSAQSISITELTVSGDFGAYLNKFLQIFPSRFSLLNRIVRKLHLIFTVLFNKKATFNSKVIGFDPDFDPKNLRKKRIYGYFQSYRYVDEAIKLNPSLSQINLINPSQWYLNTIKSLKTIDPVVMHIRRGDYLGLKDTFGVLSEQYYLNSIQALTRDSNEIDPIWIFSDNPELIESSFQGLIDVGAKIIIPPENVSDTEILMLMSHASRLVIANSTFSWWAARINAGNKTVIAPSIWFRGMPAPKDLVPPGWTTIPSQWMN